MWCEPFSCFLCQLTRTTGRQCCAPQYRSNSCVECPHYYIPNYRALADTRHSLTIHLLNVEQCSVYVVYFPLVLLRLALSISLYLYIILQFYFDINLLIPNLQWMSQALFVQITSSQSAYCMDVNLKFLHTFWFVKSSPKIIFAVRYCIASYNQCPLLHFRILV